MRNFVVFLSIFIAMSTVTLGQFDLNPIENEVRTLRIEGRCAEATSKIEEALKSDPQSAELYINRAACRKSAGDKDGAVSDALKAIDLKPNDRQLFVEADGIVCTLRPDEDCLRLETKQVDSGFTKLEAYQSRSRTRSIIGDYPGALDDFVKAMEFRPLGGLTNLYGAVNTLDKAKDDPRIFDYYRFVFDGVQQAARTQAENERKTHPTGTLAGALERSFSEYLFIIAMKWIKRAEESGSPATLEEALDKLVTIYPRSQAYETRAKYFERKNRPDDAKKDMLSFHFWRADEITVMIDVESRLIRVSGKSRVPEYLILRGTEYVLAGEYQKGVDDYNKAVELDPSVKQLVDAKLASMKAQ